MSTFYHSTRSADELVTSKQAILRGIAPDGGLYVSDALDEARLDLEHFLGARCHLDLKVKVKRNWRRDAAQIRRFGYGDGL